ncbi:hypothetical protein [Paenibacillus wynnii]|uniref:hypothetical protein n=1 Tax=Paenibacillus wynnii TaxID=268407 RepID=UPI00068E18D5|nr:hypothetical protein [Paenibacillus wynnii]
MKTLTPRPYIHHTCSRRRWRRGRHTEGSVSVFLIMVLAFVFLFAAVLIDYARIAAANTQGERLARAAIRSVMSSYDIKLKEDYGLFAFGDSDGKQLLARVLSDNLRKSGRGDEFNLLSLALESSSLEWGRPLGEYAIFRRQINEEMKYKAPIDFTLELAGKFKPVSAAMGEASRSIDLFSKLQPLYDKREDELDLMLERRSQAAESVKVMLELIISPPGSTSIPYQGVGGVSNAADIVGQYRDFVYKAYADMDLEEDEEPRYRDKISNYLSQSSEVTSRLQAALITLQETHSRLMEESRNALNEALRLNDSMKAVIEQSRNTNNRPGYTSAESWDIPGSLEGTSDTAVPNLREQGESLLLSASELSSLETGISAQDHAYQSILQEVSGLPSALGSASGLNADLSWLTASVLGASKVTYSYVQEYGNEGVQISRDKAAIESHRTSDKARKETEKQSKVKLREAMDVITKIRNMGQQAGDSLKRYDTLRLYYDENISFNIGLNQSLPEEGKASSDPYSAGSAAMDDMDGIYEAMGSVLGGARDRLFQNEYSALYFPHFDVSGLTSLSGDGQGNGIQQLSDQMDPHQQELEYILYGFHNPAGNVAAAYSEIFAMRLAVRTMEGFIEKATLGNPLAITAAALLYGLSKAIEDMVVLCNKGSIPLSKYVPAELTYRDYLRLFLLLHGGGEAQLSRMLALIRLNTGINPAKKFTYVSSEIKLGTRLWFLPGVIKALDYTAGLAGDVQKNTYYKAIRADFSY